jgi:ankyrin repeat protein
MGHVKVVELLIAHNADVNCKGQDEQTPLHFACRWGHLDIVKVLVDSGAQIDCKDRTGCMGGRTPLYATSWREHVEITKFLIRHGADINSKNDHGDTPLHNASWWGRLKVARILVEHGADASCKNNRGETPLDLASKGCSEDSVKDYKEGCAKTAEFLRSHIEILSKKQFRRRTRSETKSGGKKNRTH